MCLRSFCRLDPFVALNSTWLHYVVFEEMFAQVTRMNCSDVYPVLMFTIYSHYELDVTSKIVTLAPNFEADGAISVALRSVWCAVTLLLERPRKGFLGADQNLSKMPFP